MRAQGNDMDLINSEMIVSTLVASGVVGCIITYGVTKAINVHIQYINTTLNRHDNAINELTRSKKGC